MAQGFRTRGLLQEDGNSNERCRQNCAKISLCSNDAPPMIAGLTSGALVLVHQAIWWTINPMVSFIQHFSCWWSEAQQWRLTFRLDLFFGRICWAQRYRSSCFWSFHAVLRGLEWWQCFVLSGQQQNMAAGCPYWLGGSSSRQGPVVDLSVLHSDFGTYSSCFSAPKHWVKLARFLPSSSIHLPAVDARVAYENSEPWQSLRTLAKAPSPWTRGKG